MIDAGALVVERLWVNAGSIQILCGFGFTLYPGELCAIIGPSGAGKSTLIKALLGLRTPDQGRISLGGQAVTDAGPIGYVPQDDALHRTLTVRQSLSYAARLRRPEIARAARERLVGGLCRRLGIQDRLDVRIRKLSGGQRKRVSVALELMTDPALLILDEPTSGLDPYLESRSMSLFSDVAEIGRIVLVSTHAMQSLDRCHCLLVLVGGSLAFLGRPADATGYFDVPDFAGIFKRLTTRDSGAWQQLLFSSSSYRAFARRAQPGDADTQADDDDGRVIFERPSALRGSESGSGGAADR